MSLARVSGNLLLLAAAADVPAPFAAFQAFDEEIGGECRAAGVTGVQRARVVAVGE